MTRAACHDIAGQALLVWPIGATEQHGPHLPVGADAMHAEWVATRAADSVADRFPIVVAPTLAFGSSDRHLAFGATMSVGTETYYHLLVDLVGSLVTDGFRRIFVVNGHGGNHEIIQLAARDVAAQREVKIAVGSWWTIAWDALVAAGAHERGRLPGHAGAFETSLLLAMRPDLVIPPLPHREDPGTTDPRRFRGDLRIERHGAFAELDGYSDSPDLGDRHLGRIYLDRSIDALAEQFVAVYSEGPA